MNAHPPLKPFVFILGAMLLVAHASSTAQETADADWSVESGDKELSGTAPGVNPKDNITKAEVIIKHDNLSDGTSVTTMALKYDIAFDQHWGANIELPVTNLRGRVQPAATGGDPTLLVRNIERPLESPAGSTFNEAGIGDLNLRARNVNTFGPVSLLSAVEFVVPTATNDVIGSGKLQVNPVIGAVYAFNQQTFAFGGYKHYFSIAGEDDRENINRSEVRVLFARLFTNATWTLGDIKYSKSHKGLKAETVDLEVEYGSMLSRSIALSGRVGTSFLDSERQFGLSLNLRKIF